MDRAGPVIPFALMQIAVTLLVGLFIAGAFRGAERRAELIDELRRARSELARTEHARGVRAERERLSHEIHDTLAQGFTSILTLVQAIEATLGRDPTKVRERLALLERTARENLAEARALVGELSPVHLQSAKLTPRELEVLVAVATGRSNAEIGRILHIGEATVKTHLRGCSANSASTTAPRPSPRPTRRGSCPRRVAEVLPRDVLRHRHGYDLEAVDAREVTWVACVHRQVVGHGDSSDHRVVGSLG
jgi:DNA-directed RNA polymerase specialized sigma24 family protein